MTNRIAAVVVAVVVALAARAQSKEAQLLFQRGREAAIRGDAKNAAPFFEKAVALEPKNARYHYHLAGAYGQIARSAGPFTALSTGRKAAAELETAVGLDPNYIQARFGLIEFFLVAPAIAGGSKERALEQAREIRKRDPIDGHRAFARIHVDAEKPDLARKELDEMIRAYPNSPRAQYHYGVHLMVRDKNPSAAMMAFENAARLDPAYMPAYFQIGHAAALAANNFARGEEALRKYLAHRPGDDEPSLARAHYWLGMLFEKQGRNADARASYAASLKLNPTQKDAGDAMKRVR